MPNADASIPRKVDLNEQHVQELVNFPPNIPLGHFSAPIAISKFSFLGQQNLFS